MLKDLKSFLMKATLIDVALAFVFGAAVTAMVNSLVQHLIMPIVGIVAGKPSFDDLTITINKSVVQYGSFLTAVVNFVIIGTVLFFIGKAVAAGQKRAQAMRKAGTVDEEAAAPTELDLLTEIRDALKAKS